MADIYVPGMSSEVTDTPTEFLFSSQGVIKKGVTISSDARDRNNSPKKTTIRKAVVVGKVTASGKYEPTIRAKLSAAASATDTTLTVDDTSGLAANDNIEIRDATNNEQKTISSVDSSTQITISAGLSYSYASGASIRVVDGSETAVGIMASQVKVEDENGNAEDALVDIVMAGHVDESQLIDFPELDTSRIRSDLQQIIFD